MCARAGRIKYNVDISNSGMFISPITPSWVVATPIRRHAPDRRTEDQYRPSPPSPDLTVTQNFNHQIGANVARTDKATLRLLMTDFLLGLRLKMSRN